MEVNSLGGGFRKQKRKLKQKVCKKGNIVKHRIELEDLPESILVHILSFLPTKDALKASVLSKRWRYLWKYVDSYSFLEGPIRALSQRKLFRDTVERVLLHREPIKIQRFSLTCGVNDDYYEDFGNVDDSNDNDDIHGETCVNNWVGIALKHKVQVLKLVLYAQPPFSLQSSLFSCESLIELNLDLFGDLELPSQICLPRLKILIIRHVKFSDEQSINQLFASCPVLEKLMLGGCTLDNVNTVRISIPTLQTLCIYECVEDENNCQVVIFGNSLLTFDYRGELKNDYCLCDLSSLFDSSIIIGDISIIEHEGRQSEVADRANKLLRGLSNVRELYLCHDIFKVLNYTEEFFTHAPLFNDLTLLQVDFGTVNFACGALQKLLQKCPSLTTLQFLKGVTLTTSVDEYEWQLDTVPSCFLTKLNTVYIGDFKRTKVEEQVVVIILENATFVEKILFIEG